MQWTSSVSSRSASVRLRAVRTRIGLPVASSSSGTTGEPPGSSWISSRVRCVPGEATGAAALAAAFVATPGPGAGVPAEVSPGMAGVAGATPGTAEVGA